MKLHDAIARLNRAGDENSRATEKLKVAAMQVAQLIKGNVPMGEKLPRGYMVREERSNVGSASFLESPYVVFDHDDRGEYVDGTGCYLHGDFHSWIGAPSRTTILRFAEDVAQGWLDEVAAWLEVRAAKSTEAAETLTAAVKKLA